MKEIHSKFVAGHSDDISDHPDKKVPRTILFADYLGFERQKKAQANVQDARTPTKRLEGFVSGLTDFHAQAEWLKVLHFNQFNIGSS